jgi:hypothetical protein
MARGVEALVEDVPAVRESRADAVAPVRRRDRPAVAEIAVEVLLAAEIGAPWRPAAGAIVEGAERERACRIGVLAVIRRA